MTLDATAPSPLHPEFNNAFLEIKIVERNLNDFLIALYQEEPIYFVYDLDNCATQLEAFIENELEDYLSQMNRLFDYYISKCRQYNILKIVVPFAHLDPEPDEVMDSEVVINEVDSSNEAASNADSDLMDTDSDVNRSPESLSELDDFVEVTVSDKKEVAILDHAFDLIFDHGFADEYLRHVYTDFKKYLEEIAELISVSEIPEHAKVTALVELQETILKCMPGVLSKCKDIINELRQYINTDYFIAHIKSQLTRQIINEVATFDDDRELDIHIINHHYNRIAPMLGMAEIKDQTNVNLPIDENDYDSIPAHVFATFTPNHIRDLIINAIKNVVISSYEELEKFFDSNNNQKGADWTTVKPKLKKILKALNNQFQLLVPFDNATFIHYSDTTVENQALVILRPLKSCLDEINLTITRNFRKIYLHPTQNYAVKSNKNTIFFLEDDVLSLLRYGTEKPVTLTKFLKNINLVALKMLNPLPEQNLELDSLLTILGYFLIHTSEFTESEMAEIRKIFVFCTEQPASTLFFEQKKLFTECLLIHRYDTNDMLDEADKLISTFHSDIPTELSPFYSMCFILDRELETINLETLPDELYKLLEPILIYIRPLTNPFLQKGYYNLLTTLDCPKLLLKIEEQHQNKVKILDQEDEYVDDDQDFSPISYTLNDFTNSSNSLPTSFNNRSFLILVNSTLEDYSPEDEDEDSLRNLLTYCKNNYLDSIFEYNLNSIIIYLLRLDLLSPIDIKNLVKPEQTFIDFIFDTDIDLSEEINISLLSDKQLLFMQHYYSYSEDDDDALPQLFYGLVYSCQFNFIRYLLNIKIINSDLLTYQTNGMNYLWILVLEKQYDIIENLINLDFVKAEDLQVYPQNGNYAGKNCLWLLASRNQTDLIKLFKENALLTSDLFNIPPPEKIDNKGINVFNILLFKEQYELALEIVELGFVRSVNFMQPSIVTNPGFFQKISLVTLIKKQQWVLIESLLNYSIINANIIAYEDNESILGQLISFKKWDLINQLISRDFLTRENINFSFSLNGELLYPLMHLILHRQFTLVSKLVDRNMFTSKDINHTFRGKNALDRLTEFGEVELCGKLEAIRNARVNLSFLGKRTSLQMTTSQIDEDKDDGQDDQHGHGRSLSL